MFPRALTQVAGVDARARVRWRFEWRRSLAMAANLAAWAAIFTAVTRCAS